MFCVALNGANAVNTGNTVSETVNTISYYVPTEENKRNAEGVSRAVTNQNSCFPKKEGNVWKSYKAL